MAKENRCTYTRYADDLTFSTSLRNFPSSLARVEEGTKGRVILVGEELKNHIHDNGFRINIKKTRLQTANRRQEVTGLTVNKFPNVGRRYVNQIRAMLHAWEKYGYQAAENEFFTRWDSTNRRPSKKDNQSFARVVKGKIEFIGMVRGRDDPQYLRYLKKLAILAPKMVKESIIQIENKLEEQKKLREALEEGFDLTDIRALTFDLGIDYDNISGANKTEKVIELIRFMERKGRLQDLFQYIRMKRPHLVI